MIALKNLCVTIAGRQVVTDVTLPLAPGEVTGLVGESGSGKSMTALAAIGLLPDGAQTGGRGEPDGRNLPDPPERAMDELRGRRIGMIF